ncbi:MAG: sulfatase [Saprospiraceae bacterium]|nr:sulfatase [Saprospiraceae bacterium]
MNNRQINLFYFLLAFFLLPACTVEENEKSETQEGSPNIIIIFADDLGYGDLGTYGNPTIRTPHLDRMAEEGLKFFQFYSGASVCTPSRAALLTGRLPIRSGMVSDRIRVLFPFSYQGLPAEEITLAEALKEQGYHTGIVGKWHLGHYPQYLPLRHGFDTFYGLPYSNDMIPTPDAKWAPPRKYPPLPLYQDTTVLETNPDQRLLTKQYTEKAIAFIEAHQEEPFFLYMPHSFPHVPLFASPDFEGKSSRGLYGDVVEELDWSVGQILSTLQEKGLDKNTLVVFTSDNGPWLTEKQEGGSAGLLHQGKGSTFEGGMREPTIAWWPGRIAPGTTQSLATTMDLYATAVTLAGGKLPKDRTLDGTDLSPLFEDPTAEVREEVIYYLGAQVFAFRKGPWKMHLKTLNPYIGEQPVAHDPPLLYQLDHDPSERFNLAAEHPEVLEELRAALQVHLDGVKPVPSILEDIDQSYFE